MLLPAGVMDEVELQFHLIVIYNYTTMHEYINVKKY